MSEVGEYLRSKVREKVERVKKVPAEAVSLVKGESSLKRSIDNQKEPLEGIAKEHAADMRGEEAKRMLQVIKYYEEALKDPEAKTRELEEALKERVFFLWDVVRKHTEFDLSNPKNPTFEVLRPRKHKGEKKVERREDGFVALNLEELEKSDDAKWFELKKLIRTEDSRGPRAFRLFNCYSELRPTKDKPFRSTSIQLKRGTPGKTASEDIASVSLTTYTSKIRQQRAHCTFIREDNEIMISSWTIKWLPYAIESDKITGWDIDVTETENRDSEQKIREKYALALAIAKELFDSTEVSEDEIMELMDKR